MSRPIIEVSQVSKVYRLGEIGASSLREEFSGFWARLRNTAPDTISRQFWALQDVSFAVQPGEIVGIIGRNGAGKSTLLKILSRITEPSSGRAVLRGRVASLLEVGTGFHPDLTGRDNIFLNGAILGMKRAEIRAKFDEIVDFAEVEKFIDTPVKRYSSGMYVRLAFAVAAHLEPEILIVDEVLAVGDAAFQNKCIGQMEKVSREGGRTVLFVSHNLAAVARLCSRAILLKEGRVVRDGAPLEAIEECVEPDVGQGTSFVPSVRDPSAPVELVSAEIMIPRNRVALPSSAPVNLVLRYRLHRRIENLRVGFRLQMKDGTVVLTSSSTDRVSGPPPVSASLPGIYEARCELPAHLLNRGHYYFTLTSDVPNKHVHFIHENVLSFHIDPALDIGPTLADGRLGMIAPALPWQTSSISHP